MRENEIVVVLTDQQAEIVRLWAKNVTQVTDSDGHSRIARQIEARLDRAIERKVKRKGKR